MKYIGLLSSAASGKLGGIVASHNRGGTYFRHHAIPRQPRTVAQSLGRAQLAGFSSMFKSLTASQVAAWNALGASVTLKSKLGTTYNPTGQQLFVSCNRHLASVNATVPLLNAPSVPTIPAISAFSVTPVYTYGILSSLTLAYTGVLGGNNSISFRATRAASNGRTFIGKSAFRTIAGYNPYTTMPTSFAITTNTPVDAYTAVFGPMPGSGFVGFELRVVDNVSGFAGPPIRATINYNDTATGLFTVTVGAQAGTKTSAALNSTYAVKALNVASSGFVGAINYSVTGLPTGANYAFSANPVNCANTPGAGPTLTISGTTVPDGNYNFNLVASYGSDVVTTPLVLAVVA